MKSKKDRVLVFGYFGYEDNQLDGQTMKTRNLYTLLKSKEVTSFDVVSYFDTQSLKSNKFNIISAFKNIIRVEILFYLPAHGNLKYLFPFIFVICKLFNTKIHYVVVGGWLSKYVKNKPLHTFLLSKIDGIYPQTEDLVRDLESIQNFKNVTQLNNFRFYDPPSYNTLNTNEIRLVFMARVHPLKGVKTIFQLEKEIIKRGLTNVSIDMFGPMYSEFEEEFNDLLETSIIIKYHGILNPEDIYSTLVNYDLMLFPTQFFTEGFPGSILDAYISHVPVIVTHWKYATEFVQDKKTGVIVEFGNEDKFVSETIRLIESPNFLNDLKLGASKEADKYSSEVAWDILVSKMKLV